MTGAIDFHAHVFQDLPLPAALEPGREVVNEVRRRSRHFFRAGSEAFHKALPLARRLPEPVRRALEAVGGVALIPNLAIEGSLGDLKEAMGDVGVVKAVILGHPPHTPNEWILEIAGADGSFIPFVNIPPGTENPGAALAAYAEAGARGLKIHAAFDGCDIGSSHYSSLLETARDRRLPVILHTGCIHMGFFFKRPEQGHAHLFAPWFENFPEVTFILAHMNFHEPEVALRLMERYPNLYADTSWQSEETIALAANEVGAHRILFASDWPLGGNNIHVSLERIRQCVDRNLISAKDADLILSLNAENILGLGAAG